MRARVLPLASLPLLLLAGCADRSAAPTEPITVSPPQLSVATTGWTGGALTTSTIPGQDLKFLDGGLSGAQIWKSNNPETFTGTGWLMQSSRTDATRGGTATPLSGTFNTYLFHINTSGATRYVHVLVTNPQAGAITVSGKGSMYTNAEKPLGGAGTGLNYQTAKDWLYATYRTTFSNVSIPHFGAYQVYRATLNSSNMVDGRFEITASAGAYVYTVVTSTGSLTDAINATQGAAASGTIAQPGTNAYGREAGVYAASGWTGTTPVEIAAAPAHVGFCLNTSSKFAVGGSFLQDQTAGAVMTLNDSSPRTYANYGHKYDVTIALHNPGTTSRTVRFSLASNYLNSTNSPSFTYNGPITLNGTLKNIYTTPTSPKNTLSTWTIAPGANFNARVIFYVPGLITIGQQIILESI